MSTIPPPWLDERERRAWRGYLAMQARLTAELHRRLQDDSGLSYADYEVLVALTDAAGPLRVLELAAELRWEKSRTSHHLSRMQKRGLIARTECPDDARGAFVALTEAGQAVIERAAPGHVAAVRELVFDALDPDEVDALADLAERVAARI